MLQRIKEWWNRPPAKQRILAALSRTEWQRGLKVAKAANVHPASFYPIVMRLEGKGLVDSKWEESPPDPARGGFRRRLYRLP